MSRWPHFRRKTSIFPWRGDCPTASHEVAMRLTAPGQLTIGGLVVERAVPMQWPILLLLGSGVALALPRPFRRGAAHRRAHRAAAAASRRRALAGIAADPRLATAAPGVAPATALLSAASILPRHGELAPLVAGSRETGWDADTDTGCLDRRRNADHHGVRGTRRFHRRHAPAGRAGRRQMFRRRCGGGC